MAERELRVSILGELEIAHALLETRKLAAALGFRAAAESQITTAVSELAQNIRKYAGRGEILLREVRQGHRKGLEVVVRDSGPGIANVEDALSEHYSTSGTLGMGLPGVRRLMDDFEVETSPSEGTCVTVRKWL